MKCYIFFGTWYEAQAAYNQWAKDKTISDYTEIHTHAFPDPAKGQPYVPMLMIIVFTPPLKYWRAPTE